MDAEKMCLLIWRNKTEYRVAGAVPPAGTCRVELEAELLRKNATLPPERRVFV